MDQEKIGRFIKEIRQKNNLTQKEFADSLGVTFQAVSKWENGKNIPDLFIIKEISEKYHVDINEIISGEKHQNSKNKSYSKSYKIIICILLLIFVGITSLIINSLNQNDFELKKISTTCSDFDIVGTVAYSEEKSSMYISKVEFCGEANDVTYETISCNLYEEDEEYITKINSCKSGNNITLMDYLKDLTINVDNYYHSCRNFIDKQFYIAIEALQYDGKIITYKVPLDFKNTCE